MKSKKLVVLALVVLFAIAITVILTMNKGDAADTPTNSEAGSTKEQNLTLNGYPSEMVPLYDVDQISSFKYFVNDDPNNYSGFFDSNRNYYNVVFTSNATPEEVLSYYRSLMDEVSEDTSSDSRVEGVVGEYKISAANYGTGSPNYSYLQVHLPGEKYAKENPFYVDYPENLVEIDENWIERESSYGKLAQNGGEIEYTQYFTVTDTPESKSIKEYLEEYAEKYAGEVSFGRDEQGSLRWSENEYQVTLTFTPEHSRIYLMVRRPMEAR